MKLNRRQLRRIILNEVRLLNEGNDEATYKLVTDKIIDLIAKYSGRPKKEGEFSYEIYPGRKGKYYQFNYNGAPKETHAIANRNMLKKHGYGMKFAMTEIVETHLDRVDNGYAGQDGSTNSFHSWLLSSKD